MPRKHDFRKIISDIENETINSARVVVFFGPEDFLSDWSCDQLVSTFINPASKDMDYLKSTGSEDTIDLDYIYNFINTMPMFSQKRILVLESAELFEGGDSLKRLIEIIPDTALVVFKNIKIDKRKSFYKTLKKFAKLYEFDKLQLPDLKKFVKKRFKEAGKELSSDLLASIIEYSGYFERDSSYNLRDFEGDICKIIAHSERDVIVDSDLVAAMNPSLDVNVFAMLDAICMNDKKNAFEVLNNILMEGESVYRLLALITGQLEIMLAYKELKKEGKSIDDMQKILNVNMYRLQKAGSFAKKLSKDKIERGLINAYEVDSNIKMGIYRDKLALEMFISKF